MELRGIYTNKETVINERQHRTELYSMLLYTLNQEKYMEEIMALEDTLTEEQQAAYEEKLEAAMAEFEAAAEKKVEELIGEFEFEDAES